MIDVPGEGQQQLYNYVRSLLESSHDAYWPMIGQPRGTQRRVAEGAGRSAARAHSPLGADLTLILFFFIFSFCRLAVPDSGRGAPLLHLPLQEGLAHRQINAETRLCHRDRRPTSDLTRHTRAAVSLSPFTLLFCTLRRPSHSSLSPCLMYLLPLRLLFFPPSARCVAALSQLRAKQPAAAGAQGAASSFFVLTAAPRSHLLILFSISKSLFPCVNPVINIQNVQISASKLYFVSRSRSSSSLAIACRAAHA